MAGSTISQANRPTPAPNSPMERTFCPLKVSGLEGRSPCSLPKAIRLPVTVSAPKSTSKPSAAIWPRPTPAPFPLDQNSATPTSVAATAPNMCEMAIRCGMAVMGTRVPSGQPMTVPSASPARIQP